MSLTTFNPLVGGSNPPPPTNKNAGERRHFLRGNANLHRTNQVCGSESDSRTSAIAVSRHFLLMCGQGRGATLAPVDFHRLVTAIRSPASIQRTRRDSSWRKSSEQALRCVLCDRC